jgi:exonuclease III
LQNRSIPNYKLTTLNSRLTVNSTIRITSAHVSNTNSPIRPRNIFNIEPRHQNSVPPTQAQPPPVQLPLNPHANPFFPTNQDIRPTTDDDPTEIPATQQIANKWRSMFNYSHNYRLHYDQPRRQTETLDTAVPSNNVPWGDEMVYPKRKNTVRLYCQNINGLKLDEQGGDLNAINEFLNIYQCDLVGFSEINLDVSKYKVRKFLSDTLNKSFDANQYSVATSEIPFQTNYKPGGTMTAIFNDVVGRWHSKYADPMGRWSTVSVSGRKSRVIHLITVYQVVDKSTSGPFTVYQQQAASLRLADRDLTPRKAFIHDLSVYLRSIKTRDSAFILMGDLNEVVGLVLGGFNKITNEFDLVDIMSHHHPIRHEVATYARGKSRIDYIFCTSNLIPAVRYCGIEPFHEHIFSDHRSICL